MARLVCRVCSRANAVIDSRRMETVKKKISRMLEIIGIEAELEVRDAIGPDDVARFTILTDDARVLIGHNGQNLHSLEYLLKRMLQKEQGDIPRFFLDVNGYRANRLDELKEEARGVAKKVRLYRKEVRLRPMNSFERRIIHTALAEYPDITTESIGDAEQRAVVIKPYP